MVLALMEPFFSRIELRCIYAWRERHTLSMGPPAQAIRSEYQLGGMGEITEDRVMTERLEEFIFRMVFPYRIL